MDQDKTTVMGGCGSAQAGDSADATRVVPNPGYVDPCLLYTSYAHVSADCIMRPALLLRFRWFTTERAEP